MQDISERVMLDHECQECGYSPSKGDVIMSRARFERLLLWAGYGVTFELLSDETPWDTTPSKQPIQRLRSGDLDPLP